jgi:hypothetical protein
VTVSVFVWPVGDESAIDPGAGFGAMDVIDQVSGVKLKGAEGVGFGVAANADVVPPAAGMVCGVVPLTAKG